MSLILLMLKPVHPEDVADWELKSTRNYFNTFEVSDGFKFYISIDP